MRDIIFTIYGIIIIGVSLFLLYLVISEDNSKKFFKKKK